MKIESFKVKALYRGVALEGICRSIYPSTYMVTMKVPYKGLSKAQHFFDTNNGTFTMETIQSMAGWELGRLYEQYQDIKYDYAQCKKLMNEWAPYEGKLQRLKNEAVSYKQGINRDNEALLDFYIEALNAEAC